MNILTFEDFKKDNTDALSNFKWNYEPLFHQIINKFGENSEDFKDVTVDQLYFLWWNKRALSKSKFYNIRGFVGLFFDWVGNTELANAVRKIPINEILEDAQFKQLVFRDEVDLDSKIEELAKTFGFGEDGLLDVRALALLYWYGFHAADVIDILKSEVDVKNNKVRDVTVSDYAMSVIKRHRDVDIYTAIPSGTTKYYKDSPYLFRTYRKEKYENTTRLYGRIKYFNEHFIELGKRLTIPSLARNGMFVKVYDQEKTGRNLDDVIYELYVPTVSTLRENATQENIDALVGELRAASSWVASAVINFKNYYLRWKMLYNL